MVDPPAHIAARRTARRSQLRRRRMLALGGVAGIVAVVVAAIVIASAGGGGGSKGATGAGGRRSASDSPKRRTTGTLPDGASAAVVAKGDATIQRLARLGLPIYCAGTHGDEVAFTFDDGPGPYTYLAIKKLREAHERGTFFVVGRSMDNYPNHLPAELTVAALGDHTYTHPELTALAPSEISSEISRTKQKIEHDSRQPVYLFRPPYGAINPTVQQIAKGLNLLPILWTEDSTDSLPGANYLRIISYAEAGMHPGSIILFHENRGQTIRALTTLLPELHRRHLRSVSLPELFATDPPTEAQMRAGPSGCGVKPLPANGATGAG